MATVTEMREFVQRGRARRERERTGLHIFGTAKSHLMQSHLLPNMGYLVLYNTILSNSNQSLETNVLRANCRLVNEGLSSSLNMNMHRKRNMQLKLVA